MKCLGSFVAQTTFVTIDFNMTLLLILVTHIFICLRLKKILACGWQDITERKKGRAQFALKIECHDHVYFRITSSA